MIREQHLIPVIQVLQPVVLAVHVGLALDDPAFFTKVAVVEFGRLRLKQA